MITASDYFSQSNDNTFNVVFYQQCFEHDEFVVAIKRGGIITPSSVSKPGYTIITNVGNKDDVSVLEYERFGDCVEKCEQLSNGHKLKPSTKFNLKQILNDVVGRYVVLSKHNRARMIQTIEQAIEQLDLTRLGTCINDPQLFVDQLHQQLSIVANMTVLYMNKQMYCLGLRTVDNMYRKVVNLSCYHSDQNVQKLGSSINILINYLPRYD